MKFYIYNNENLESVSWQEYNEWKRNHGKEFSEPAYNLNMESGTIQVQMHYDGIMNDTETVKPFWVICAKTFLLSGIQKKKKRSDHNYMIDNIEMFEKWDDALERFIEITEEVDNHKRLYNIINPIKFSAN